MSLHRIIITEINSGRGLVNVSYDENYTFILFQCHAAGDLNLHNAIFAATKIDQIN